LLRPAQSVPLLLVLEDAHWIDPTTHELLRAIIDRARNSRVLILITARPETQLQWPAHAPITSLSLSRLRRQACIALIERVLATHSLPAELVERIVERADGVPLFAEELTLMLLESSRTGATATTIPETLHDSLMARLDRLPGARAIAQAGSAIGREFDFELLLQALDIDPQTLDRGLRDLERAELLFRSGEPPHARYTFKHALLQDAAYGSLVKSRRAELHRRLLAALQQQGDVRPEILARHAQEAGQTGLAVKLWRQGAESHLRRGAALEAAEYLRRALAGLAALPDDTDRLRLEQSIYARLGVAQMGTGFWGSEEISSTFERACALGRRLGQPAVMVPALIGAWVNHMASGQFSAAQQATDEMFDVARQTGDDNFLLQAHHAGWPLKWRRNRLAEADAHVEAGIACYDEVRHAEHRHIYLGHDPGVCGGVMGAIVAWARGRFAQSLARQAHARELAERLNHLQSSVQELWMSAETYCHRQDVAAALETATRLRALCDRNGINMQLLYATSIQNWARAMSGEPVEIGEIVAGARQLATTLAGSFLEHHALAAEACLHRGAPGDALGLVAEARERLEGSGDNWTGPILDRMSAKLALATGEGHDVAEAYLLHGMAVARDGGGLGYQLRLGLDLARLYAETNRREEAQLTLKPILDALAGESVSADLVAARTLFAAL
jgi:tetratricopeptide (TPR) repeat protein